MSATAPSGLSVPPAVREYELIFEEVMGVRSCPLGEVRKRAHHLAERIVTAEAKLWELQQAIGRVK